MAAVASKITRRMKWTPEHDVCLLKEMLLFEPWSYKYGSKERGNCWERISESLNQNLILQFKASQRGVQERYQLLEKAFKKKKAGEERASGISPEESEVDRAMADIIERFEESKRLFFEKAELKKIQEVNEVAKAEEVRRMSLESLNETGKRKFLETTVPGDEKPEKKRSKGNDVAAFLGEKMTCDRKLQDRNAELREKELEVRKAELANQRETANAQVELFQTQLRIQQQEINNNSQMMMQMMQQQQQLFVGMINMLNSKPSNS